jgi:hypothetical protein
MKHSVLSTGPGRRVSLHYRRVIAVAVVMLAVMATVPTASAGEVKATPGVTPFSAHFRGGTYADWQVRWYQWFAAIPAANNPLFDETGAGCHTGQSGKVWFSAPVSHQGTTERTCTLAPGTALFVLGTENECSTLEAPPFHGDTDAELRACATAGYELAFGDATFSLRIDGRSVNDLASYRTQTAIFPVTYPAGNVVGANPGTGRAASDGVFIMIPPLSLGSHRVELHGDIASGPLAGTIDENYTIIIGEQ